MRTRASQAAVIAIVLFTACAPEPVGPSAWRQPPEDPGPIELIGHRTTATHSGDRGVSTHPADEVDETPTFCIAYFDDDARDDDTCEVGTEPFEWEGELHQWTVQASWSQLDAWDDVVDRLAIHAFDDAGQPVAHWTGRMNEDAGHLTE